jgi:hypothetical protein
MTAFIASDTFCGDGSSISPLPAAAGDGRENVTGRSWHRGSTRSRHSFIASMSPANAASTALRVSPRASPSSNVAAASVALFREPRRRPAGLPDYPLEQPPARPRPRHNLVAHRVASRCHVFRVYIWDTALRQ